MVPTTILNSITWTGGQESVSIRDNSSNGYTKNPRTIVQGLSSVGPSTYVDIDITDQIPFNGIVPQLVQLTARGLSDYNLWYEEISPTIVRVHNNETSTVPFSYQIITNDTGWGL